MHVLDYKPDARTNKPIAQLAIYALALTRRVSMPGSPYGLAIDHRRHRLFVTQTARNQLTELTAEGRPHVVARYPTPRQPNSVAVDERSGRVAVTGKVDGVVQLLDPRDLAR